MVRKKRLFVWGLACLLLTLLAGSAWNWSAAAPYGAAHRKLHFGFSTATMNNPYFVYMEETLRERVEQDGYKLTTLNAQYDGEKQVEQILDMLENGVDLLFLSPVNNDDSIAPALEACGKAGVPIVNIDSGVFDAARVQTLIQSHNYMAGYLCALDIRRQRPEGCKIAIIDDQKAESVVQRMQGFYDGLKSLKQYQIIDRFDTDGSIETAMPTVQAILQHYPAIDVFMCGNDTMALGAIAAIRTSGLDESKVLVYGIDGSPDAKKMIAEGHMTATAAQSPDNIVSEAYAQARNLLSGQEVRPLILIDTFLIDRANVEEYNVSGWQ